MPVDAFLEEECLLSDRLTRQPKFIVNLALSAFPVRLTCLVALRCRPNQLSMMPAPQALDSSLLFSAGRCEVVLNQRHTILHWLGTSVWGTCLDNTESSLYSSLTWKNLHPKSNAMLKKLSQASSPFRIVAVVYLSYFSFAMQQPKRCQTVRASMGWQSLLYCFYY